MDASRCGDSTQISGTPGEPTLAQIRLRYFIEADRGVVGVAHRQPHVDVRRRLHTVECACSRRVGRVAAASIPTTDLRSVKCKSTVMYVLSRTFLFWMTKADLGRNPLIVCCRGRHERHGGCSPSSLTLPWRQLASPLCLSLLTTRLLSNISRLAATLMCTATGSRAFRAPSSSCPRSASARPSAPPHANAASPVQAAA